MGYADPEKQREALHQHYLRNKAIYAARRIARRAANPNGRKEEAARAYTKRIQWQADKVYRALCRLSRDKWLSPHELHKTGMRLSRCLPGPASSIMARIFKTRDLGECVAVGMLRGRPPFIPIDLHYETFLKAMLNAHKPKAPPIELTILQLLVREMKLGR